MIEAFWFGDEIEDDQSATPRERNGIKIASYDAAIWSTSSFLEMISSRTKDSLRSS